MKVAHISDLHFCAKHLRWIDVAMEAFKANITENPVDLVIISGDSFEREISVHDKAFVSYVRHITEIASFAPVVVLQGTFSHDRPGSLNFLREIESKHRIVVIDEFSIYRMKTNGDLVTLLPDDTPDDTRAIIAGLPSVNKAEPEIMKNGAKAYVDVRMEALRSATEAFRAAGTPVILTAHGEVVGCVTESKHAMVSPDHEFTEQQLYSSGADAVMLGHIHAMQTWENGRQIIAYAGSMARLVHGDFDAKGWLLWEFEPPTPSITFIESPTRRLLEATFDGPPVISDLRTMAADAGEDDTIRVRYSVNSEYKETIDTTAIRRLFSHCESVAIEGNVIPVTRVRAEGISRTRSIPEQVKYWVDTTDIDVDPAGITDSILEMQSSEIDEIVQRIIGG